ncbi:MAG: hypothetical protein IK007_01580 [Lachnospiraceae bacterium]|nr:hypothetical protein [Lachnospiraceae bacterium]
MIKSNTTLPFSSASLLYNAAATWTLLLDFTYEFVYGFKKKLYTVSVSFSPKEFYHLAGFHYLDDLSLPKYNAKKLLTNILTGTIKQEQIEKSIHYEALVKPRLIALSSLKTILDSAFAFYSFKPQMCPFHTSLKADYLIAGHLEDTHYIFLIKENQAGIISDCICSSTFIKEDRDYETNQRSYTLLKKSRTIISENITEVIYIKDGFSN